MMSVQSRYGLTPGFVGSTAVQEPKAPLPPKLTSLPPALAGVFRFAFQVASAFVTNPFILKNPLALGTRARNEAMEVTFRVTPLLATLTQMAFVSPALLAEMMKMP